jgi:hypothetical protein
MSPPRLSLVPLLLLFALATPASAQDETGSRAIPDASSQGLDQLVYKGLVGNVLDAIPMDPIGRVQLQRTNAVVSNTLFGRSLAVLAGLSNPVLLLGGFVWGMWAASNIKPAVAVTMLSVDANQSGVAAPESMAALLAPAPAAGDAAADTVPEPIRLSSISAGVPEAAAVAHPRVIKVWLPQRSPMLPHERIDGHAVGLRDAQ